MENIKPDIQSSFTYRDQLYRVDWYTVTDKSQIPDLEWKQIYMVGGPRWYGAINNQRQGS